MLQTTDNQCHQDFLFLLCLYHYIRRGVITENCRKLLYPAIFDPAGKNCKEIRKIKLNTVETKKNKLPLRGKPQECSIEPLCFVPAHQSQGQ